MKGVSAMCFIPHLALLEEQASKPVNVVHNCNTHVGQH